MLFKEQNRIRISLYLMIPTIFSGISVINVIVTHRLTENYMGLSLDYSWQLAWFCVCVGVFTFSCCFFILWLVLNPVTRFIKRTEMLPVLSAVGPHKVGYRSRVMSDMEPYTQIFDKITDILSKVEARELFPDIIGQSNVMLEVCTRILKVSQTETTVLITGESGTGKDLVATGICEHSKRNGRPFIKVNCVAIPEGLMESELFGHEKGAFTGAISQKKGKFEMADKGTLFMDEIGDMPVATQAKLLRVLQEREFERVGGVSTHKIDIRIITATNKDLSEMVNTGHFREDLYHRLNVFHVHLPPLRERKEDIPMLVKHFLKKIHKPLKVSSLAFQALMDYEWPGNVRELNNVIERASVLVENGVIKPEHLPVKDYASKSRVLIRNSKEVVVSGMSIDNRLKEIEKSMVVEALAQTGGVQSKAARLLGINQRSLWHKVKKHQIDVTSLKKSTNVEISA